MARGTRDNIFDELASGLANGTLSRGKALKLMGAALAGGALASLGIGEAAADRPGCKRNGKACKSDTQCCSGTCSGGTCASCRSVGGSCTADIQCCADESTNFLRICDIPASQSNGTCATCRSNGSPCSSDGECCSGDCPISTHTCATPCLPNCSTCTEDSECCTGNCDGGICEPLACV